MLRIPFTIMFEKLNQFRTRGKHDVVPLRKIYLVLLYYSSSLTYGVYTKYFFILSTEKVTHDMTYCTSKYFVFLVFLPSLFVFSTFPFIFIYLKGSTEGATQTMQYFFPVSYYYYFYYFLFFLF